MKKTTILISLILALTILLTGCIRMKEVITINENGDFTVSIISAVLDTGDETQDAPSIADYEDLKDIEGLTVEDYNEDGYKGIYITYSANLFEESEDGEEMIPDELNEIGMPVLDGFIREGDKVVFHITSESLDFEGAEDMFVEAGAIMEITITYPFAAIETSATTTSADMKTLTWDLFKVSDIYAIYNTSDVEGFFGEKLEYAMVNPFSDVEYGAYYHDSVLWAYANEITTGTSATKFSPESSCTRGQVVTFLWRTAGMPEPETTENPFTDVKESDYFFKAVLWAVENGITNGTTATTFSPEKVCSNAHILTFIYRALGEPYKTGEGEWYEDAVNWAEAYELTADTYTDSFDPTLPCPRKDVVTFLFRASYIPAYDEEDEDFEDMDFDFDEDLLAELFN